MTNIQGNNAGLALSNAIADAVEQAARVTVLVDARKRLPLSGIIYGPNLVLTADHGVEREEGIRIILPDGSEAPATIAGRDRGSDLALLRIEAAGAAGGSLTAAQPASQEARIGNLVLAVGRPSNEGVQATLGLVNAFGSDLRTHRGAVLQRVLVTDATPLPGFSGGPLVDLAGGILGVNTSGLVRGASLAIPLRLAWETAENLARHGHIKRGYLGVRSQVVEIPEQARASLERAQASGLLLVGVEPEGPAASALMVGDILVGIAGQPVADHDELIARLVGDTVGRPAEVQVLRGGQMQTVSITVGERN